MGFKQLINRTTKSTMKRIRTTKAKSIEDDNVSIITETSSLSASSSHSNSSSLASDDTSDHGVTSVRFAAHTTVHEAPSTAYFYEDEVPELWCTKEQRRDCQDEIRMDSKLNKKTTYATYVAGVETAYRNARYVASTTDGDDLEQLLSNSSGIARHAKGLNAAISELAAVAKSCRGLEEVLSGMYAFERESLIEEARSMIVSMSQYQGSAISEETAKEYSTVSRTAVVFARLLAETDASIVLNLD